MANPKKQPINSYNSKIKSTATRNITPVIKTNDDLNSFKLKRTHHNKTALSTTQIKTSICSSSFVQSTAKKSNQTMMPAKPAAAMSQKLKKATSFSPKPLNLTINQASSSLILKAKNDPNASVSNLSSQKYFQTIGSTAGQKFRQILKRYVQ